MSTEEILNKSRTQEPKDPENLKKAQTQIRPRQILKIIKKL